MQFKIAFIIIEIECHIESWSFPYIRKNKVDAAMSIWMRQQVSHYFWRGPCLPKRAIFVPQNASQNRENGSGCCGDEICVGIYAR